jgi:hypothetical protein
VLYKKLYLQLRVLKNNVYVYVYVVYTRSFCLCYVICYIHVTCVLLLIVLNFLCTVKFTRQGSYLRTTSLYGFCCCRLHKLVWYIGKVRITMCFTQMQKPEIKLITAYFKRFLCFVCLHTVISRSTGKVHFICNKKL